MSLVLITGVRVKHCSTIQAGHMTIKKHILLQFLLIKPLDIPCWYAEKNSTYNLDNNNYIKSSC